MLLGGLNSRNGEYIYREEKKSPYIYFPDLLDWKYTSNTVPLKELRDVIDSDSGAKRCSRHTKRFYLSKFSGENLDMRLNNYKLKGRLFLLIS